VSDCCKSECGEARGQKNKTRWINECGREQIKMKLSVGWKRYRKAEGTKRLGSTETKGDKNEKRPRVLTGDQGLGEKGAD
jgi:hypothetical protein